MKLIDKILCIIMGVLALACLVLEFIPGQAIELPRAIVAGISGVYALGCLIYFSITKDRIKNKIKRILKIK